MTMTPKQRAEKSAAAMWADDHASKWAGMEITHMAWLYMCNIAVITRPQNDNVKQFKREN